MRIYTKAGDLAFKAFTFPDGQPHFKLETYDREFDQVTVEVAIKSPHDLLLVLLVSDVLRAHGYANVNLDVRYLMGARMDRAIGWGEPFTLSTIARLINGAGFSKVRILDVHSEVATRLIRNSENLLPFGPVKQVVSSLSKVSTIIIPDKGATERVHKVLGHISNYLYISQASKVRDVSTGALTGFYVEPRSLAGNEVVIIDDICDGGGTFVGLAKELRKNHVTKVYLFVTHGIFSKGPDALTGIDHIYTTNSFTDADWGYVPVIPVTVIPVSMKEM